MDELLRASLAVGSALQALRAGRTPVAVVAILDQAAAAVRDLRAGPFSEALHGVLLEIDRCRRASEHNSARLDAAIRDAVHTLTR